MGDLGSYSNNVHFVLFVELWGLWCKGAIDSIIWWQIFLLLSNYLGRNTHLLRVRVWISKFDMLCALRQRRNFMALSVTVHGSEQLRY